MCVCVCIIAHLMDTCVWRVSPHPPEVFPVGLFGNVVFGIDLSLQGAEASPLRDVFFAEHARHLKDRSVTSSA